MQCNSSDAFLCLKSENSMEGLLLQPYIHLCTYLPIEGGMVKVKVKLCLSAPSAGIAEIEQI